MRKGALVAAILLVPAAAHAAFVLDQSNTALSPGRPTDAIGGGSGSEQKLAQTFTVGMTGQLAKLRLPIGCASGTLVIDIVEQSATGLPDGRVLRRTTVPAASIPLPAPAFRDLFLVSPMAVTAGDRLAIVLYNYNDTGSCGLVSGGLGNTYPRGEAYFDARPNPRGVWLELDGPGAPGPPPSDLPFETFMEVPGGGGGSVPCEIWGAGGPGAVPLPPIPRDAPICRCLRDQGLREFRCTLLDPAFFAIRRIPLPIPLDRSFVETWEVLPLAKFDSALRLHLEGLGSVKPIELSFKGGQRVAVEARKVARTSPARAIELPGTAKFSLGDRTWTFDTTISADLFAAPVQGKPVPPP